MGEMIKREWDMVGEERDKDRERGKGTKKGIEKERGARERNRKGSSRFQQG